MNFAAFTMESRENMLTFTNTDENKVLSLYHVKVEYLALPFQIRRQRDRPNI